MASTNLICSGVDTSDISWNGENNSYKITAPVGTSASSPNAYGGLPLKTGSNAASYFYVLFDTSSIPQDVTIDNVSGQISIYETTTVTSRTSTRYSQLTSGTAKKGTSTTFSHSSTATVSIDGGSNWTRAELDDLRIYTYAQRNTSSTSNTVTLYWRGADVTIEYTEDSGVKHTVTITAEGVTVDEASAEVKEGTDYTVYIRGGTVSSITDNGADVKSQLVEVAAQTGGTITGNPTAYTTSGSISGTNYKNAVGKGSSNTASGNDYASGGSYSTATITYSFDFSDIPSNATIDSVEVKVGGHAESTSNSSRKSECQLYSGSTAKGSAKSFTSTSKQVLTMDAGTWTRAELQSAKLQFTIGYYGGLVNGVDWTVTYSVPGSGGVDHYEYTVRSIADDHVILINMGGVTQYVYVKSGSWTNKQEVKKIYKKSNGVWKEIDATNIDSSTNYQRMN